MRLLQKIWGAIITFVDALFVKPDEVVNHAMNQPVEPSQTAQDAPEQAQPLESLFTTFCAKIIQYEGAVAANNNPFNDKYYFGGYLPKYGTVKESVGGFAMFSTYALGYEYGTTIITEMCNAHPTWDFLDFFATYAPSKDNNNPVVYAKTIAAEMGTIATTILKTFLGI